MKDAQFRFGGSLAGGKAKRIGIEKRGDSVAIFVSLEGEPMHQFGPPIDLHFDEPFYVGIGFCSHLPATPDTAVLSNVVLENSAGKVRSIQILSLSAQLCGVISRMLGQTSLPLMMGYTEANESIQLREQCNCYGNEENWVTSHRTARIDPDGCSLQRTRHSARNPPLTSSTPRSAPTGTGDGRSLCSFAHPAGRRSGDSLSARIALPQYEACPGGRKI